MDYYFYPIHVLRNCFIKRNTKSFGTSIHIHVEETKSCYSVLHYVLLCSINGWSHIAGIFCHSHCAPTEICGKFPWSWWHGKLPYFRIDIRTFSSLGSWKRNQCPKWLHMGQEGNCVSRDLPGISHLPVIEHTGNITARKKWKGGRFGLCLC